MNKRDGKRVKKNGQKGSKGSRKPQSTVNSRSKIQADIDDDKILEFHCQRLSYREIGKKVKLSHSAVKKRLDSLLKKLGTQKEGSPEYKVKLLIIEHKAVQRKAWQILNKKDEGFKFKYLEVITKCNQEIARLEGLYPKEAFNPNVNKKTFEDAVNELDDIRDAYRDDENIEDAFGP